MVFRAILQNALRNKKSAKRQKVFALEALPEWVTKEEALAGLNEMIRMGRRCSTELYAEMLMAAR